MGLMVSCFLEMPMAAYLGYFGLFLLRAQPVMIEVFVLAASGC